MVGWLQWEFRLVLLSVGGSLPPMGGEGNKKGEVRWCGYKWKDRPNLQWDLGTHVFGSAPRPLAPMGVSGTGETMVASGGDLSQLDATGVRCV